MDKRDVSKLHLSYKFTYENFQNKNLGILEDDRYFNPNYGQFKTSTNVFKMLGMKSFFNQGCLYLIWGRIFFLSTFCLTT